MRDFPIVISFFTKNTLYQLEVQNLLESCRRFGLRHSIEGVESFGSWELNCAYKPFFILEKIKQLHSPVLWVDADGVFVQKPINLPEFSADAATRIHVEYPDDHPSKVISSTVYINDTLAGISLLRAWAGECKKQLLCRLRSQEFWDQTALRDAIQSKKDEIQIQPLPIAYARIFDHPQDLKEKEPPVIEHYQASRRLKKMINEAG